MTDDKDKIEENETYISVNIKRIFDVYEPLICKQCNKSFEKKTCFKSHLKSHEFDDHIYDSKKKRGPDKNRPYTCNVCEKGFTAKKNLLKHLRVIHKNMNEAEKLQVKKTRCPETNCLFACRKMRDLRNHIEKFHEIKILKDTLHFLNEEGFLKWKKEEEDNSVASFVSFRRKGFLKNGLAKKVLLCHRTGQYNPKGKGKHRLKSHGSCKIGGTCPAAMEIIQCPDGQITVYYYKTHLGHSQDIIHLQLSREDRAKLSERIEQGFSLDAILDDVKDSIDPETGKTKRIHLLSRKDLYNIMQSSNKKVKSNLKTEMDEIFLNVNQENGNDSNKYQSVSDLQVATEQGPEGGLTTDVIAHTHLTVSSNCENIRTVNAVPEMLQNEAPNLNGEMPNQGTSQLVIVSPNTCYKSLAEVILLQPPDVITQNITTPSPLTENKESKVTLKRKNKRGTNKKGMRSQKSEEKNMKSQSLIMKLQEKITKICDFLPQTEYLTPKQYEIVDRKLDGVINLYDSINVKTKKLGVRKKIDNENGEVDVIQENAKVGIECIFTSPESVVQQQVYETPLYAYVCNFN